MVPANSPADRFGSNVVSFTPGFSLVENHFTFLRNRFNGFP
jgi:hypothetical protein